MRMHEHRSRAGDVLAGLEARALRVRLYRLYDIADARTAVSRHVRARAVYQYAAERARAWAFCHAPACDLRETISILGGLLHEAAAIEQSEARDG